MKKRAIYLLIALIVLLVSKTSFADEDPPGMMTLGEESMHIISQAMHKDLPMVITDPQGRRLGFDSRTNKPVFEFKGGYEPGGRYEDEEWHTEAFINLTPGEFTIEVFNLTNQIYRLYVVISSVEKGETYEYEHWAPAGQVDIYKVVYDGTGPARVAKYATPEILKSDIRRVFYSGENDGLMTSLLKKAEAIEGSIARGNKTSAGNQIDAFINEVKALTSVYFEEERGGRIYIIKEPIFKEITREDSKLLINDVQYIKDHL